ncbi:hypothetical protein [Clostridium sp.]|uniref:hypothetical protein n=1 Tax=Clostridium sp. TaxID=1506 RepID=UPI003D6D6319
MIKIAHKREVITIPNLPVEVVVKAMEITTILEDNYGETRNIDHDLGGYILIAEVPEDVETIKKLIDFGYTLPEYVELISCENGDSYTNSLMLLSSDYSISLIILLSLTPKELLKYMGNSHE